MLNLEDRIGEFLVPHLKDFIFEELSESFLEKLGLADVMKGVPVPLRKTELNKITIVNALIAYQILIFKSNKFSKTSGFSRTDDKSISPLSLKMQLATQSKFTD